MGFWTHGDRNISALHMPCSWSLVLGKSPRIVTHASQPTRTAWADFLFPLGQLFPPLKQPVPPPTNLCKDAVQAAEDLRRISTGRPKLKQSALTSDSLSGASETRQ